jgi:ferredoxin
MITVNKKECIGCGSCAAICPEVFELKDNKAVVKKQSKDPCVKEAAESCPVNAIKI